CSSRYAPALASSSWASFMRSSSTPQRFKASTNATPSLSLRSRSSSGTNVPPAALEPIKLRPNRAPSSSAQSTKRTVTGGLPPYCSLILRIDSGPASTFRQPSSQPPPGTESMCPPMTSSTSDSPCSVDQTLPAASMCVSRPRASSFWRSQARASSHTSVQATRQAPFSSAVRARRSLSSATVRFGSSGMSAPLTQRPAPGETRARQPSTSCVAGYSTVSCVHLPSDVSPATAPPPSARTPLQTRYADTANEPTRSTVLVPAQVGAGITAESAASTTASTAHLAR